MLDSSEFQTFLNFAPELRAPIEHLVSVRTAHSLKELPFFKAVLENKPWNKLEILAGLFRYEEHSPGRQTLRHEA